MPSSDQGGILRAAGTVSILTVASRILGLVRDILSAVIFGSGMVWDSFVLAFTIPNLFRRIFGEGALTSSFLPAAVKVRKEKGEEAAGELTSSVASIVGTILLLVSVLISAGSFIYLWRAGFDNEKNLTSALLAVIIFYLPFICVSAVLAAALNSVKHFAVPAFTPVLLNLVWIAVLAVISPFGLQAHVQAFILAFGIIGGGVLQLLIQIPVLKRHGIRLHLYFSAGKQVKAVFSGMLPVVFALVVMQINVLIDRLLAMHMIKGSGAVSALFYGNRLMQFPLAIFGIAISVAVFPSLREYAVDGAKQKIWSTFNLGVRMLVFIIIPCSIGLIAAGQPVIDLFFNWGAFAKASGASLRTYYVLCAYSTGLLFFCFNILITKTYHSLDNRKFPAWAAGGMVFLNLGLNLLFLTCTGLKEAGLALSTSITALVNVIILLVYLVKKYGFNDISGVIAVFIKTAAASAVMGVIVVCITGWGTFSPIAWGTGLWGKLFKSTAGIGAGAAVYFLLQYLLRTSEMKEIGRLIKGRA